MSDLFYAIAIFVLFFALITWHYGNYAQTVMKWSKKPRYVKRKGKTVMLPGKLDTSEIMQCYIPVWQSIMVRKSLYRTAGVFAPISMVGLFLVVLRLIIAFFLSVPPLVHVITIYGVIIGFVIIMLTYGIITADCAKMYGFSNFYIVMCFLLPCLVCNHMTNNIATVMRNMHKEETFNEHNSDTVIKQKHSQ